VRAEECVLVEDTPRNLTIAKELGMTTILVGSSSERPEYVDYLVAHPARVTDVLAELLEGPDASAVR
jgi:FMN phosphatase YigB (HAD superfamily)